MLSHNRPNTFGRRNEPHRIIIAHGDVVQDFTVRPWVFSTLFVVGLIFSALYLSATTYLVFRDEIISFSRSEQAMIHNAYEDRITDLRAQLDRVASRQMINQQEIESRVQTLMRKQADYESYSSVLAPILKKAEAAGVKIRNTLDMPTPKMAPWRIKKANQQAKATKAKASDKRIQSSFTELASLGFRSSTSMNKDPFLQQPDPFEQTAPFEQPAPFEQIASLNLKQPSIVKDEQIGIDPTATDAIAKRDATIVRLADAAQQLDNDILDNAVILGNILQDIRKKTERVERRIASLGVTLDTNVAMGGPYLPLAHHASQEHLAAGAEKVTNALDQYMRLRENLRKLPIAHPLPSGRLTSRFGPRRDPFLGRMAMHSGLDIAQAHGTPIRASGAGKVTHAGRRSGYGLMVEIDHGNGVTSRYAHMSKVIARKGQWIKKGATVGKVGSSGRSTGPHLHFETRIRGKAVNPSSFLLTGIELRREL
ncbi:MAG: M23 family metallopeptidase [Cohaesibacter sp.]|nr:M23 family metallopeptidase [Cohaesibacter sp.]